MQYIEFSGQKESRIIKGNWQLAGGHGEISLEQAISDLTQYAEHGVNVYDVGDIYTGVEEIVGKFLAAYRQSHGDEAADDIKIHTKFVPDLEVLETVTKQDIKSIILRSIERLGTPSLDLVQFHWWDYSKGDFVQAGRYLQELKEEGLINAIGLTNFDVPHTKMLLDAGIEIESNQIQFSLLDARPLNGMIDFAKDNGIAIFCYGVLAGGLLGSARPNDDPTNRSHIKYGLVINEAGQDYYDHLLEVLAQLAKKYQTTPANIAAAYVLATPGITSVILGARNVKHIDEMEQLADLTLSNDDYLQLRNLQLLTQKSQTGDIYSYERDMSSDHAKIMKYNLNGMKRR